MDYFDWIGAILVTAAVIFFIFASGLLLYLLLQLITMVSK